MEVDDKTLTVHPLFRDLICRSQAFGAKSWLHTLQRTCERISYSGGVLRLLQQREPKGGIIIPSYIIKLIYLLFNFNNLYLICGLAYINFYLFIFFLVVNNVPSAREKLIKLSTQMVKSFWATLSMPKQVDIPDQLSEMHNDVGVRVSVRKNTEPRQPEGIIVCAAASFGLPVSSKTLFNFFKDEQN